MTKIAKIVDNEVCGIYAVIDVQSEGCVGLITKGMNRYNIGVECQIQKAPTAKSYLS